MNTQLLIYLFLVVEYLYINVKSENVVDVSSHVQCSTTKGNILIEIYREWSPLGADRFIELVRDGFFTDIGLFRCVSNFLTQFGISDKPQYQHWHNKVIRDDPNLHKGIKQNYLSFAGGGPNTRSTQLFIAFEDLDFLGHEPWETPFGKVIDGQETLNQFYKGYGDIPPFGQGPDQQKIYRFGNSYLHENFPLLDYILSCHVIEDSAHQRELSTMEDVSTEGKHHFKVGQAKHLIERSTQAPENMQVVETDDLVDAGKEIIDNNKENLFLKLGEREQNVRLTWDTENGLASRIRSQETSIVLAISILGILLLLIYGMHLQRRAAAAGKKS
jgi:cyclophilin family peptidyl-prolyl cis-trans isomerase